MSDNFRKNSADFDALRELMEQNGAEISVVTQEPAPEYWQALLDISEDLNDGFQALKNPTWAINGYVSNIVENLRIGKARLEKIQPEMQDERFKIIYADTIKAVVASIEKLEKFQADEMRRAQIRLTIHERVKKV